MGLGGNGDAATDLYGHVATPVGPGALPVPGPGGSTINPGFGGSMIEVATTPVPGINAFGDLIWQNDGNKYFGYQPAAPAAREGLANNDPIPSPDQQTFTDLVVNIVNPDTAGRSRSQSSGGQGLSSGQPLIGPDYFVGFSYTFPNEEPDPLLRNQNFDFPNIAVVVEAARGNLENTPVLPNGLKNSQAALIDRPVSVDGTIFDMRSISTKDGYQRAYQRLAMLATQPLGSVLAAMDGYLQKLHKYADCRMGLVSFSSAGSLVNGIRTRTCGTANDTSAALTNERSFYIFCSPYGNPDLSNPVYDSGWPTAGGLNNNPIADGSGFGFRIPRTPLDFKAENYLECSSRNKLKERGINGETTNVRLNFGSDSNGIYNCRVGALSDSGEALQTAYDMFHGDTYNLSNAGKCRGAANKLIVFFTDGEPTGGINGKEAQTMLRVSGEGSGIGLGSNCEAEGIAIFTVGLNLAKGITFERLKENQLALLGDKQLKSGGSGGIAWRAGHGGRYYACENLSELKSAFAEIARHFTQGQ